VKYRLNVEGIDEIMIMVGERISKLIEAKDAKMDSTPLETSRYDFFSDFNPHYGCKMDKAHITMIGTFPIFMNYTDGLKGDSPQVPLGHWANKMWKQGGSKHMKIDDML